MTRDDVVYGVQVGRWSRASGDEIIALLERVEVAERGIASLRSELEDAREALKLAAQDIEAAQARAARIHSAADRFLDCMTEFPDAPHAWNEWGDNLVAALAATEADVAKWVAERDARVRQEDRARVYRECAEYLRGRSGVQSGDVAGASDEHDARVRAAALTDNAFVAAALEAKRLETLAVDPARVAQMFHEAYERLAPNHSYKTREASAKPWSEVPENNRALMTATVREVFRALAAPATAASEPLGCVHGRPPGRPCPHCMGIGALSRLAEAKREAAALRQALHDLLYAADDSEAVSLYLRDRARAVLEGR